VVRLKFSETETKKNMAIVRMVSQIIEGVAGERVNEKMKAFIEEHGFDEFHRKIAEATRQAVHEHFMVDESEEEAEAPVKKKEKIPGYF
jgi:dissimilatory sulfite reductase (desulfoviridin) alpha/beta subunit